MATVTQVQAQPQAPGEGGRAEGAQGEGGVRLRAELELSQRQE